MLVLSRQRDQSIVINGDIEVAVVDIRGDKVRLGVTAPKNVSIHRREIYDAIQAEMLDAARMQPGDFPAANGHPAAPPLQVAMLVSGSGTTLQNLLDERAAGRLPANLALVVGSKPGLMGVQRAAQASVPNVVVDRSQHDNVASFSREVFEHIDRAGVDLVCLGGWLSLLQIPDQWVGRVMNIHPALLPSFGGKGMYGRRVHEAVIAHGCKLSGCTVHFVDNEYDAGPIILQRACPVLEGDTAQSLAARVFEQERLAYPEAIRLFQQAKLRIEGRRVTVG